MAWSLGQAQAQERHIGKGYLNLLAYWDFDSANAFNTGTAVDVVSKIEGELLGEPKLVVGRSGQKLDRAIDFGAEPEGNWVKIDHKTDEGPSWLKPVSDYNQLTVSFWQKLHMVSPSSTFWLGAASALIQVTMNWAQRSVSPTRATVIYAGEPVWAGVVGRLAGERLPAAALLGAALIVCGVIVSELRIRRKKAVPDQAPLEP